MCKSISWRVLTFCLMCAFVSVDSFAKNGDNFRTDDIVLLWRCGEEGSPAGTLVVFTHPGVSEYRAFLQGVETFVIKRTIPILPQGITVFYAFRVHIDDPLIDPSVPPIADCVDIEDISKLPKISRSLEERNTNQLIVVLSNTGEELLRMEGGPAWGAFVSVLANVFEEQNR
jgi:hypothetical protein